MEGALKYGPHARRKTGIGSPKAIALRFFYSPLSHRQKQAYAHSFYEP